MLATRTWAEPITTNGRPQGEPVEPGLARFAHDEESRQSWVWYPDCKEWFEVLQPAACGECGRPL
jgi:hypothetical protein